MNELDYIAIGFNGAIDWCKSSFVLNIEWDRMNFNQGINTEILVSSRLVHERVPKSPSDPESWIRGISWWFFKDSVGFFQSERRDFLGPISGSLKTLSALPHFEMKQDATEEGNAIIWNFPCDPLNLFNLFDPVDPLELFNGCHGNASLATLPKRSIVLPSGS